ncbi:MAG: hypothetical protein A2Y61_00295 [Chloroflexi bacterium RBG_13_60_13]|nr:MAG: hypothetical protein A2Y61_00295 [Chloroflexi bacterium RBG_13_60_13]
MIYLTVENNRTSMVGADSYLLNVLDLELRYPSPIALANESGVILPGDSDWDGWIRLLRQPKTIPPWFPTGLLPHVVRYCIKHGYEHQIMDHRQRPELDVPEAAVKIPLRDYQQEAVRLAIRDCRGVIDCPPRSGKTRMACEIQHQLHLNTVWIAPTDRIVTQTQAVLEVFFGPNYSSHLVGTKDIDQAARRKVVVCTAATASRLPAEFYRSRQCVIVDEFHHGSAPTYRNIFNLLDHVYYRYGMTGTFFRSGEDELAMHALLSTTIFKITSTELLRRGYLVPSYVAFIPVLCKKLRGVEPVFQTGHGKQGIHEHQIRQQLAADAAFLLWQTGRKVLILVGTKRQGHMLRKILLDSLPPTADRAQFESVEFVSTDIARKTQGEILESFESSDEVKVLIGTSILGEGVDLPAADALVYARGEKAEVTLTQNVYRTCTAVPGKTDAVIVDFADRHHRRLLEHSQERLRVYYDEPTFSVTVLGSPQQFPGWLEHLPPGGERRVPEESQPQPTHAAQASGA